MSYGILAQFTLVLHILYILFAVSGGLLALLWKRAWMIHLPAVLWGLVVEFLGFDCPLTTIENYFRTAAGQQGYGIGFIDHFLSSVIYPDLSPVFHILLGIGLGMVNMAVYAYLYKRGIFDRPLN